MGDPAVVKFFQEQVDHEPSNVFCCDCGTAEVPIPAPWASVSFGIYLSIGASGIHRSLGVKTSVVLSTTMDHWKPVHLRMMELGGNRRFNEFLREQGIPDGMPIRKKYRTRAADWYRENLRAMAEETTPPTPLTPGTGHLPGSACGSAEEALLDDIFAVAPQSGMTSGGVSIACRSQGSDGKQAYAGRLNLPDDICTSFSSCSRNSSPVSSNASTASPSEKKRSGLIPLALEVHRTMKGHRTARRLRTTSTGSMVGFGSESCGALTPGAD